MEGGKTESRVDVSVVALQTLGGPAAILALTCVTLTAALLRLQALIGRWCSSRKEEGRREGRDGRDAVEGGDGGREGFGPNWEWPERLDWEPARRRVREAYRKATGQQPHVLFSDRIPDARTEEGFVENSRGVSIFTKSWMPGDGRKPKAVVCFCHGYGDTCTFYFEGIARYIAARGYGVFAMDYPGFGLSAGLHGYVPSFDQMVGDVVEHFGAVRTRGDLQGLPCFLFGQSMGGAVALKAHFRQPEAWNGAVLVAPMCKMADAVTPPWIVVQVLKLLCIVLPKAKLVPQEDLAFLALKELEKREKCRENVVAYKHLPRLRTALELLKTTEEIERRLADVSLPLLVLHGAADRVTDPSVSQALVEKASSEDKILRLYEDAWHSIMEGEPDETIFQVLEDIVSWLDAHSG